MFKCCCEKKDKTPWFDWASGLRPKGWVGVLVALLLVGQYWLATSSKLDESTTSDEIAHITSGLSYWLTNDYRLQPENGNLPQRWEALPAFLQGYKLPRLGVDWKYSDPWRLGSRLFYEGEIDHRRLLISSRAMNALFLTATSLLVFVWSRRLWGTRGGLISLCFIIICPTFLAHGALATSDMCMAFFMLAAVGLYWRHLHDGRTATLVFSSLVFGLACVAKFSAVMLLPMMVIMSTLRFARGTGEPVVLLGRARSTRGAQAGSLLVSFLVHCIVAWLVIWAFYGFRFSAFNPEMPAAAHFIRTWEEILAPLGVQRVIVQAMADLRLLPEAFLYGYAFVVNAAAGRSAFLDGEYSITGWVRFFPLAFFYKTPLAFLTAIVASSAAGIWLVSLARKAARESTATKHLCAMIAQTLSPLYRATPLIVLFLTYWAFALTSNLNIGQRHLMPVYPVLFIFVGILSFSWRPVARAWHIAVVAPLLALGTVEMAAIYPHYLAFFNQASGGPANGYRHLVDSSSDWGQDLPGLARWLREHRRPSEHLYLSYFGTGSPGFYGIDAVAMPSVAPVDVPRPAYWMKPGIYAISATMLQHVYSPFRGAWTPKREEGYRLLKADDEAIYEEFQKSGNKPPPFVRNAQSQVMQARSLYDHLRFARLCHYLRTTEPLDKIGYSIFVYRLTKEDLAKALEAPMR
jgi:hypothetical protein